MQSFLSLFLLSVELWASNFHQRLGTLGTMFLWYGSHSTGVRNDVPSCFHPRIERCSRNVERAHGTQAAKITTYELKTLSVVMS